MISPTQIIIVLIIVILLFGTKKLRLGICRRFGSLCETLASFHSGRRNGIFLGRRRLREGSLSRRGRATSF